MKTIKGPAVFLAQFAGSEAPFNSLDGMCKWASDLGYKGIQIPTWETNFIDIEKLFLVHYYGIRFTLGHKDRMVWLNWVLKN